MQKQRHGVCHRCGWVGPISRVAFVERLHPATRAAFGRLCGDCRVTVVEHGRPMAPAPASLSARLLHRWDAA